MLKASMAILSKEILENASVEKELMLEHLNSVIGYPQNGPKFDCSAWV